MKDFITRTAQSRAAKTAALAGAVALTATAAHATTTDTTFDGMSGKLETWLTGSLGILLGLGGLVVTIASLMRQQYGGAAVGIVVALAGATGPAIIKGIFGGII